MSESDESFSDCDATNLQQKALYVQPAPRRIDLNTVPADGHEFIHKSRLEDSLLQFSTAHKDAPKSPQCNKLNKHWIRKAVADFSFIANDLKSNRDTLKKIYTPTNWIPITEEEECCTFCLGSEKCSLIYKKDGCPSYVEAQLPLLGDLLQFCQSSLFVLIKYHFKWFKIIGMDSSIHIWLFALFLCKTKPLSNQKAEFFEDIYDECKDYLDELQKKEPIEEEEIIRVHLILSILENYFCVNLDCSALGSFI